jgi:hypothetical protein
MTEPRTDVAPPARPVEPPPPGGHGELERLPVAGAVPAVPGTPPVVTTVPIPATRIGQTLPGVQLAQRIRRQGDTFGWPANAAPSKPEGEVDTRP